MTIGKRVLGKTGIEVGEIGMGAWQLGAFREWDGPDHEASFAIVDEALRLGCDFFDTAPPYADGRSEEYLGQALKGRRERAVICTKFGFWPPGYQNDYSPDRIEESVERSLERLQTDYLDVLLMHGLPEECLNGTTVRHFEVMRRLADAGTIRAFGVEMGSRLTPEALKRLVDTAGISCAELRFNPLVQKTAELFETAAASGVGLIISVPLEMGWLSGKYDADAHFTGSRGRWTRKDIAQTASLVAELRSLLPGDLSLPQASLRYILAHPEVSTIIPGAKSVAQVRDNAAAAGAALPLATLEAMRAFGERHGSLP
jgi:aryl-alcohol dehydrogenase-like predicted oxidoreductase